MQEALPTTTKITFVDGDTTVSIELPSGSPLYQPIPEAARIAGVSEELMRRWCDRDYDPIPHIEVGKAKNKAPKKLVNLAAIPEFLKRQEA